MTELTSPPGYGPIVPFDRNRHKGLGLGRPDLSRFAQMHAVMLHAGEFVRAALDYPVAFAATGEKQYIPTVVLGLRTQQNLYIGADGRWEAGRYVPAYVRRHPFFTVGPTAPGSQRLVFVQEDALTPFSDTLLVDKDGNFTPAWETQKKQIEIFEDAFTPTLTFTERLSELDLLVPFDALGLPAGAQNLQLTGLYRVDEARLWAQPPEVLRELAQQGYLKAASAHAISLEHLGRLLDLSVSRG